MTALTLTLSRSGADRVEKHLKNLEYTEYISGEDKRMGMMRIDLLLPIWGIPLIQS
jgi:hypothetical protein